MISEEKRRLADKRVETFLKRAKMDMRETKIQKFCGLTDETGKPLTEFKYYEIDFGEGETFEAIDQDGRRVILDYEGNELAPDEAERNIILSDMRLFARSIVDDIDEIFKLSKKLPVGVEERLMEFKNYMEELEKRKSWDV